jgi:hypothetical protein
MDKLKKITNLLIFIGFDNLDYFNTFIFMYDDYHVNIKNFDDIRIINIKIGIDLRLNQKNVIEFLNIEFLNEIRKAKIKQLLTDDS